MQVNSKGGEQKRRNALVEIQYTDNLISINSNYILASQDANWNANNDWCMEEEVLARISVIRTSIGSTKTPKILAVAQKG